MRHKLSGHIGRAVITAALFVMAVIICFPIVFAVGGAFMPQWELKSYLAPVLGGAEGLADWPLLPQSPTLQPLVERRQGRQWLASRLRGDWRGSIFPVKN